MNLLNRHKIIKASNRQIWNLENVNFGTFWHFSENLQKWSILALFEHHQKSYFLTLQSSNQRYNIIEKSRNTKILSFFTFLNFEKLFFKS